MCNSFFTGYDLLSGESTRVLDDAIDVHVPASSVLADRPVFAEHLWRDGSVAEDVVENGACLAGGDVELARRHEVANDVALFEGQSVVVTMFGGGRGA